MRSSRPSRQLHTFLLLGALTALLVGLGGAIGGAGGLVAFVVVAVLFNVAMYFWSGPIALKLSRAARLDEATHPDLFAMNRRLALAARVPAPALYLTETSQPNAFATGRNPDHAAIAVTRGLLDQLDDRQVEGVLAHEMAHIANRDILVASVAAEQHREL